VLAAIFIFFIMLLSYRIHKFRGYVSAVALALIAFLHLIYSFFHSNAAVFPQVAYIIVFFMAINGVRGTWFGRGFGASS
jgi:hypothetical protein